MLSFRREFSTQQTPRVSVRPSSTSPTSSSLSPLRHDFAFEQCGSRLNFLRWIFFSLIRVGNEVLARFLVDYLASTWIRNSELKWVKSVIGACRVEKIVLSWKSLRILFFFSALSRELESEWWRRSPQQRKVEALTWNIPRWEGESEEAGESVTLLESRKSF